MRPHNRHLLVVIGVSVLQAALAQISTAPVDALETLDDLCGTDQGRGADLHVLFALRCLRWHHRRSIDHDAHDVRVPFSGVLIDLGGLPVLFQLLESEVTRHNELSVKGDGCLFIFCNFL